MPCFHMRFKGHVLEVARIYPNIQESCNQVTHFGSWRFSFVAFGACRKQRQTRDEKGQNLETTHPKKWWVELLFKILASKVNPIPSLKRIGALSRKPRPSLIALQAAHFFSAASGKNSVWLWLWLCLWLVISTLLYSLESPLQNVRFEEIDFPSAFWREWSPEKDITTYTLPTHQHY